MYAIRSYYDEVISSCNCRKPKPGMILKALSDHHIDPNYSFLIGDSNRDIEAGEAAGLKGCFKIDKNTSIRPIVQKIIALDNKNDE